MALTDVTAAAAPWPWVARGGAGRAQSNKRQAGGIAESYARPTTSDKPAESPRRMQQAQGLFLHPGRLRSRPGTASTERPGSVLPAGSVRVLVCRAPAVCACSASCHRGGRRWHQYLPRSSIKERSCSRAAEREQSQEVSAASLSCNPGSPRLQHGVLPRLHQQREIKARQQNAMQMMRMEDVQCGPAEVRRE